MILKFFPTFSSICVISIIVFNYYSRFLSIPLTPEQPNVILLQLLIYIIQSSSQAIMAQKSAAPPAPNNLLNNYKGVMLCSRPNENVTAAIDKPFCGRVVNSEQVGLAPVKRDSPERTRNAPSPPVHLTRHKQYIAELQEEERKKKKEQDQKQQQDKQRFLRIRLLAEQDRERAKKAKMEYEGMTKKVLGVLDGESTNQEGSNDLLNTFEKQTQEYTSPPVYEATPIPKEPEHVPAKHHHTKKKGRPAWSQTAEQIEQQEEQEVDELLDFFEQTDVAQFSEDEQVKNILKSLHDKIEEIKRKEEKAKAVRRAKRQEQAEGDDSGDEDKRTHAPSVFSESRSIASERAQKNIEQLRQKKQSGQQDWDKHTTSQRSVLSTIDDKIAKNIADEVLRNYPNLKGTHSNNSIRKLLEAEASRALREPVMRPIITTIVKERQPINVNNLPFLHRNEAI